MHGFLALRLACQFGENTTTGSRPTVILRARAARLGEGWKSGRRVSRSAPPQERGRVAVLRRCDASLAAPAAPAPPRPTEHRLRAGLGRVAFSDRVPPLLRTLVWFPFPGNLSSAENSRLSVNRSSLKCVVVVSSVGLAFLDPCSKCNSETVRASARRTPPKAFLARDHL